MLIVNTTNGDGVHWVVVLLHGGSQNALLMDSMRSSTGDSGIIIGRNQCDVKLI